MKHSYDTFPTPLGDFSVALDESGAVIATAFGDVQQLRKRFSTAELVRDAGRASVLRREISEYFAGKRHQFTVNLNPSGTAFQRSVWTALCQIPHGETRTYGQVAAELGQPAASRAVGRANATNPICLIVPCHRVIGADGSLTGFAFGEELKRRLLEHEGALSPALV